MIIKDWDKLTLGHVTTTWYHSYCTVLLYNGVPEIYVIFCSVCTGTWLNPIWKISLKIIAYWGVKTYFFIDMSWIEIAV